MEINKFFGTLLHSVEVTWSKHLRANNYNVHVVLNEFYDAMIGAVDSLIEHYIGLHGQVGEFENAMDVKEYSLDYLQDLYNLVNDNYDQFTESEIQGDLDNIKGIIAETLYKLKEMIYSRTNESLKHLSEFINENLND